MFKKLFGKGKSGGKTPGGSDEPMPTWETAAAAPPEQLAGGVGDPTAGAARAANPAASEDSEWATDTPAASEPADPKLAISLFARFEDPARFERVAEFGRALAAEPRRTEEGVAGIGYEDESLVQIVLDAAARAELGRTAEATARAWLEELRGAVGPDLAPGEYAGVSYCGDDGVTVQLTWTILSGSSRAKPRVFESREEASASGG